MSGIRIIWNDEGGDEEFDTKYIDLIPLELLQGEGVRANVSHLVVGPKGGETSATCTVRAEGSSVYIDYEPYRSNSAKDILLGELRLEFDSEDRRGLPKISWRDEGKSKFVRKDATPEFYISSNIESEGAGRVDDMDPFDPFGLTDERKRTIAAIKMRRGQAKFREKLLLAYSRRCAITGCTVEAVLEAAHIISYQGPKTNHVKNGLLLRADMHTLFDLDMIGIDVSSSVPIVILHKSVREVPMYKEFHGCEMHRPRKKSDWPSEEALRDRFASSGIVGK